VKVGSLRLRLLAAGALSVLLAIGAAAWILGILFEQHVERRLEVELKTHLDQLVAGLEVGADGQPTLIRQPADPRFGRPLSGLYWQLAFDDGARLERSRSLWDAALELPPDVLASGAVHRHLLPGPRAGEQLLILERSVQLPARFGAGHLRAAVAIDRAELAAARRAFVADLWPYLGVLAALLLLASVLQVQVGLSPLRAVRGRLGEIRAGRRRSLGEGLPSEVQPLATELDALLEARDRQVEQARARAADLAHGLRTPLQVLAGDAESLRNKGEVVLAREIEDLTAVMRRHVDRELARARLATAVHAEAGLREVAGRVLAVVRRTPDGTRLAWEVEIAPESRARIDPDDLAEVLGNLVENAARHARRRVRLADRIEAGQVVLSVADDGPGIPADRREAALGRGGRLDERGGAGLGLAIVQDVLAAWGGTLELADAAPGLVALVRLPRAT
jgi:signal transduction histidine kinase